MPDRKALAAREAELVNEDLLHDSMCMNLKSGGFGGFCNEEHQLKCSNAGIYALNEKLRTDQEFKNRWLVSQKSKWENVPAETRIKTKERLAWKGRHHVQETKDKIGKKTSISQKGENNSQHGKMWIFNDQLLMSKSILKNELEIYLLKGWKQGRKIFKNIKSLQQEL